MKKEWYVLMIAVLFLGLAACSDNDDKKEKVAGTYTGTLTVNDQAGNAIGEPLGGQKITITDTGKDKVRLELKDFKFGVISVGDLVVNNVSVNHKGGINGSATQVPIMNGAIEADLQVGGTVKDKKADLIINVVAPLAPGTDPIKMRVVFVGYR